MEWIREVSKLFIFHTPSKFKMEREYGEKTSKLSRMLSTYEAILVQTHGNSLQFYFRT